MADIVRSAEEVARLENARLDAFDEGVPCAGLVADVLNWLQEPDAPAPMPPTE